MSSIKVTVKGNYNNTIKFLKKLENGDFYDILAKYADICLDRLKMYTPYESGLASDSWYYNIDVNLGKSSITFFNNDIEGGQNVIILLEYGHATKNGGWVQGIDIVDPALEPVFKQIVDSIWEEVFK